jgi:surface protein
MKKLIYIFLTVLIVGCSTDDDNYNDNTNDLQKEWLYTHTALEATATSSTTIVIPFTEDIFAFTDRPNREFKYISGDEFASYWNDYDDENSFKLDPPNAVLTWVDTNGVSEVEVVITDADFDGNNVIYTIENTSITANQSFEDVSLFVDGNGSSNAVYVGANNIIKASAGAVNNDQGNIGDVTYTVVNLITLKFLIEQGDDVTKVVPSLVTDMSELFQNNTAFNQDISSWDVSNVANMNNMFSDINSSFNQPLGNWDVSSVTDMGGMFDNASAFNQPIGNWNVSNVTDMADMFREARAFNQPIGNWDVSNVRDMRFMFWSASAASFNQPLGNWDVSNVTDMRNMFTETPFNQDISLWNVSNVTNMGVMFGNTPFNQPIGNWDVSNITNMEYMFYYASLFNKDLSSWSVDGVIDCANFSVGATSWTLAKPNFTNCTP